MNVKLGFALIASLGAMSAVGCVVTTGDATGGTGGTGGTTTTSTVTSTATTSGTTTASSTSTGMAACEAPTGDDVSDCVHACDTLFDCGVATCSGTDQQCPMFAPMGAISRVAFHSGGGNGCDAQCNSAGLATFVALGIDPADCVATITDFSANAGQSFTAICGN
jgi:hypothetical protein